MQQDATVGCSNLLAPPPPSKHPRMDYHHALQQHHHQAPSGMTAEEEEAAQQSRQQSAIDEAFKRVLTTGGSTVSAADLEVIRCAGYSLTRGTSGELIRDKPNWVPLKPRSSTPLELLLQRVAREREEKNRMKAMGKS